MALKTILNHSRDPTNCMYLLKADPIMYSSCAGVYFLYSSMYSSCRSLFLKNFYTKN